MPSTEQFKRAATKLEQRGRELTETMTILLSTEQKEGRFKRLISVELDEDLRKHLELNDSQLAVAKRWMIFDIFCACVVCVNGVYLGVQADLRLEYDLGVELAFLIFFMLEYNFRFWKDWIGTLKSGWCWLDLGVIWTGIIDVSAANAVSAGDGEGDTQTSNQNVIRLFRILRLLRLLRLVKLVKFFRELLLLTTSALSACKTVMWAVILLILLLYAFAVMLTEEMKKPSVMSENPLFAEWWGTIPKAMVTLMQVTTGDNIGFIIRESFSNKPIHALIIALFWMITSLGVLNLIIGAMVTAAVNAAQQQEATMNMTALLRVQAKLQLLWHKFRGLGMRPMLEDPETLTLAEFHEQVKEEAMSEILTEMKIVDSSDIGSIQKTSCRASGRIEVDALIEGIVRLRGSLVPADMWSWIAHQEVMAHQCTTIESGVTRMMAMVHGICGQANKSVDDIVGVGLGLYDEEMYEEHEQWASSLEEKRLAAAQGAEEARTRSNDQQVYVNSYVAAEETMWGRFDSSFGMFVLLQGMIYGISGTDFGKSLKTEFEYVNTGLLGIFYLEYMVRFRLFRETEKRCGGTSADSVYYFPTLKVLWNPRAAGPENMRVPNLLTHFVQFNSDIMIFFDCFILIVATFDLLFSSMFDNVMWFKIVRIVRVARVLRVFRLFRELWVLASAVALALETLAWVLFTLFLLIFVFSIALLEIKNYRKFDSPVVEEFFGSFGRSTVTLFQVASYDDWPRILRLFLVGKSEAPEMFACLILFIVIARLNVLNFLVGMMCHCARSVVETENRASFRRCITQVRAELDHRAKAGRSVEDGAPGTQVISESTVGELFKDKNLQQLAARVHLTERDASMLLLKLDPASAAKKELYGESAAEASAPIETFVDACVRMNTPVEGSDIYMLKVTGKCVEMSMVDVSEMLARFVIEVEAVLERLSLISEITAQRTAAALSTLLGTQGGEAVKSESLESVKRIAERSAKARAAIANSDRLRFCAGEHAFKLVTPRDSREKHAQAVTNANREFAQLNMTPRALWEYLNWGGEKTRVEEADLHHELDMELGGLRQEILQLERQLDKQNMAAQASFAASRRRSTAAEGDDSRKSMAKKKSTIGGGSPPGRQSTLTK